MLILMGFSRKSDEHLTFGPLTCSREDIANLYVGNDGETAFRHACMMGLEGIVAKRRDKHYRS
jgi:ATP-dependent DNA ligase